ncbi:MAG: YggS family pyridoxal phosphate-dependent enzyme [Actinomycetota bacterium]
MIADNLTRVRERIAAAAARAGRDPNEIKLVTVTKGFPVSRIVEAIEAGADALGENRAREAADKFAVLGREVEGHRLSWHIIGMLQTNKVKYVIGFADLIHSVDRQALAAELDKRAQAAGKIQSVLIEVNVSGEKTKAGISPDKLTSLIDSTRNLPNLKVRGLMTMAPAVSEPESARSYLRLMRELFEQQRSRLPESFDTLSMGMTGDFEVAVEEGATLVRIGRAIMGERPPVGGK